ncbi:MAG: acyl-CoA dehydrogenase family protein [Myxococcota bacterium]
MDLRPDENLELIAETARRFGTEMLAPKMRSAEAQFGVDEATRQAFHQIGLAGLEWPEDQGGAGLGSLARVLVNEELGAADAGAALALDSVGPALYPILEMGGEFAQLLAPDAQEHRVLLVSEFDGDLQIQAESVKGIIPWVPARRADSIVILKGDRAAIIRNGFTIEPLRGSGLRAAGAGELRITDAEVQSLLVHPAGAARARARTRLYVASLLLGVMRAACDFSREYAKERQAFGKPIGHHQALAFLITDMQMALDGARLLVHHAAWHLDEALPCENQAASALAECIEASRLIGPSSVQILGGHGFMADYPVEKYMREARALGLYFGGFDAAVEESGHHLCQSESPLSIGLGGTV